MTSRDFAYWLQGFFEIADEDAITKRQADIIKKHLNLVFKHEIDPSMGDDAHQNQLNTIHNTVDNNWLSPGGNDERMRC